jgi:methionyl-tRNA formyltransferase
LIDEKIDTGQFLLQKSTPIGENENFGALYTRLKKIGSEVLVETVQKYMAGEIEPKGQAGEPTRAPKLTRELRQIDWTQPSEIIRNLVRGLSPVPAAFTFSHGKILKIFACDVGKAIASAQPGEVVSADAKSEVFEVSTGDGVVRLHEVQLEGKKRLAASEFLSGHHVKIGDRLGQ